MSTYDYLTDIARERGWQAEGQTRVTRYTKGDQTIYVHWCAGPRFVIRQANLVSSSAGDVDAVWHDEVGKVDAVAGWLRGVMMATEADEAETQARYGMSSEQLADEAEAGYDPNKFVPYARRS